MVTVTSDTVQFLPAFATNVPDERVDDLQKRLNTAVDSFQRLSEVAVTVARLKPEREYIRDPVAAADPYNRLIYVPIDDPITDVTLFHELAHLDIRLRDEAGDDVPVTSEKFCSIYAVSQMPPERIDRDRIAYLGRPSEPRSEWPSICRRGLEYRREHHDYIQQTKEWLGI